MMEKKKETQGLESVENNEVEQQMEGLGVKGKVTEKPDLFRKISDAIPQRHVNKLLWFFIVLIVFGLGINIYSTFWGNPQMRSKLKKQAEETEMLQKELDERKAMEQARMLEDGSVVPEDLLKSFDDTTSGEEIFDAYGNTVAVDGGELN